MTVLVRQLNLGDKGMDVYAVKRGVAMTLGEGRLARVVAQGPRQRETFGDVMLADVKLIQKQHGIPATGTVGQTTFDVIVKHWDSYAASVYETYRSQVQPTMVFPIAAGPPATVCQGLHQTAGLLGNWAIDFCAPPGAPVVAPEPGWVSRLSGHPPTEDLWDSQGVFGWTVYLDTRAGYRYFITHMGKRAVKTGDRLMAGDPVGFVGDQHYRPDHLHCGCTSPLGPSDARKRIVQVSRSKRVPLPV
jgi:hypothetical protein